MTSHHSVTPASVSRFLTRRTLLAGTSCAIFGPAFAPLLTAFAQGTPIASPVSGATLDDILEAGVANGIPGIALAIGYDGETIYSGAAGVASLEEGTSLQATDRFRIYSITKTFVATMILQLVDEGVLTLADTVAQLLDDPAVARIPNVDTITIRQLLNHTSGIYNYLDEANTAFYDDAFFGPEADWAKVWTVPELLAYVDGALQEPYFSPGEGTYYSNTGYLLLGMIVEQASGTTFEEELDSRILTPLNLSDTSMETGASVPDDVVDAYHIIGDELANVTALNLSWVGTSGAMVSTAADLMRFGNAVFSGEMLTPESFDEMFTFVPDTEIPELAWGMGILNIQAPIGDTVGGEGGAAGGTAYMTRHTESGVVAVMLANWGPEDGTIGAIRNEAITWTLEHQE